jgi:hypothetical protein
MVTEIREFYIDYQKLTYFGDNKNIKNIFLENLVIFT